MTESAHGLDQQSMRYPLSFTQEWFCMLDREGGAGAFSERFILVCPIRVTGHVDIAVLQGALDDVVARHELLRTIVVSDADPPYQLVRPPCPVPLEVRDLPPAVGTSRDMIAQELILEVQDATMSAREVPLLRGLLCRFDDRDSVLFVTVHHSVSDGWSVQVILRDLGAFYEARASGVPAKLPPVRQYHEYSEWQRAEAASPAEDGAPKYWAEKLRGAREFTMPTDRPHPETYTTQYSMYAYLIEADVVAEASALAAATRSSIFMVMLSACYVLAHQITGDTDLAIRALTAGRSEVQFQETMGTFINAVPFRIELSECATFRDVVKRTRETCIDAMAHELPVNVIEESFPDFVKSREDPRMTQFIISDFQSQFGDLLMPIAEGAREIHERLLQEPEHPDIPTGMVWNLDVMPSGDLSAGVLYNLDEFDASTAAGWGADYRRIVAGGVSQPDSDWRTL
jgi:hypothetical protein